MDEQNAEQVEPAADVADDTADQSAEPEVVVEIVDVDAVRAQLKQAEADAAAAAHRKAHAQALQNEHDYLTRQPQVDQDRVAAVKEQLAQFSDKPASRRRETRKD